MIFPFLFHITFTSNRCIIKMWSKNKEFEVDVRDVDNPEW